MRTSSIIWRGGGGGHTVSSEYAMHNHVVLCIVVHEYARGALVRTILAKPIMAPSRAPRDGFCRLRVPLDAWRRVAKGDEPVPIKTASGVYIVASRSSGRSPQPTQHRWRLWSCVSWEAGCRGCFTIIRSGAGGRGLLESGSPLQNATCPNSMYSNSQSSNRWPPGH